MPSILEIMECHAAADRDRIAMRDDHRDLSRGKVREAVVNLAGGLEALPAVVGILAPNGCEWAIAQLAAMLAGKTVVPLPGFFSREQLAHVAVDAGIEAVLTTPATRDAARACGLGVHDIRIDTTPAGPQTVTPGYRQIIYTSGSTGAPKGVCHSARQVEAISSALATAVEATVSDCYLSVLPLAMLLETVAAVLVPTLVGGCMRFDSALSDAVGAGEAGGIAAAFDRHQPTASTLVPQLLDLWTAQLRARHEQAPASLRFVAVGGAPIPTATVAAAEAAGIPVIEGYGLSECCSVVSLNRPGARRAGTVGRPLDALDVRIEGGEIVVDGPTVMDGYLGRDGASRPWHTGDLGRLTPDGYLIVQGRKDNLIVNAFGRNISPEWVEMAVLSEGRVALCGVAGHGAPTLAALLVPSAAGIEWFADATEQDVVDMVEYACRDLPAYAVPRSVVVLAPQEAMAAGLITRGGGIARDRLDRFMRDRRTGAGKPSRAHSTRRSASEQYQPAGQGYPNVVS